MINVLEKDKLSAVAVKGVRRGLSDVKAGRVAPIEKVAKSMDIKL